MKDKHTNKFIDLKNRTIQVLGNLVRGVFTLKAQWFHNEFQDESEHTCARMAEDHACSQRISHKPPLNILNSINMHVIKGLPHKIYILQHWATIQGLKGASVLLINLSIAKVLLIAILRYSVEDILF
jgi:hypothetical protein